jgi:hypothetical protein
MDTQSPPAGGGFNYVGELIGIQMRNAQAMRLAQQKMLEGIGSLAQHQTAMLQATLRRSFSAQPAIAAAPADLGAALAGRIEALKTAMLENQANWNILAELAARSSGDVAATLQSRLVAALDEVKAVLQHATPEHFAIAGLPAAATLPPRA